MSKFKFKIGNKVKCILPEGENKSSVYNRNEDKGGSGWEIDRVFAIRKSTGINLNGYRRNCHWPEEETTRNNNYRGIYEDWLTLADPLEEIKSFKFEI